MRTEEIDVTRLRHFPGNARQHANGALLESVRLGQYRALVVREMDNGDLVVVCGNGTLDALIANGNGTALAEVRKFSDSEARRVNIADNRLHDLGSDDPVLLAALLADVDSFDYPAIGYTDKQIAKLLGDEGMPDEGDAPTDDDLIQTWGVIVECSNEADQISLLRMLAEQGWNVRAISG